MDRLRHHEYSAHSVFIVTLKSALPVGNYLYLEASSHSDRSAQLVSPLYSSGHYCFSAYYHMYGVDTGTLSFQVLQHGQSHTMKSFRGNLGNHWNHVRMEMNVHHHFQVNDSARFVNFYQFWVSFEIPMVILRQYVLFGFQIVIEGDTGHGSKSDIGLDDLSVTPGHC